MTAAVPSLDRATKGVTSSTALDFLKKPQKLLIGGNWVSAKSGKTLRNDQPGQRRSCWLALPKGKNKRDEKYAATIFSNLFLTVTLT